MARETDRRSFLKKSVLGVSGIAAVSSLEEQTALAAMQQGTTVTPEQRAEAGQEPMPYGKIGNVKISRLILGSNLIGGFAHSRDLLYVSELFKQYNTERKILGTFELAEQLGVNTILTSPPSLDFVQKYNEQRGGKLQPIVYIRPHNDLILAKEEVDLAIDKGACAISTHGAVTDRLVRDGNLDPLARTLDLIKKHGVPAGVGGHSLETPKAVEEQGVGADFYHKTFHDDRYWSASPDEAREEWCWYNGHSSDHDRYHDNMFCLDAEATAAFMATVKKPWIAFKVLAAGAIKPKQGFSYAMRHGADFICCGMFDFQICEDVKLVKETVRRNQDRDRPWMA
jgi:hypothetical protein